MKSGRRTANMTWEEVAEEMKGQVIDVYIRGVRLCGRPEEKELADKFKGTTLIRLTKTDFQVMEGK